MKKLVFLLAIVSTMFMVSCEKDDIKPIISNNAIENVGDEYLDGDNNSIGYVFYIYGDTALVVYTKENLIDLSYDDINTNYGDLINSGWYTPNIMELSYLLEASMNMDFLSIDKRKEYWTNEEDGWTYFYCMSIDEDGIIEIISYNPLDINGVKLIKKVIIN